MSSDLYVQAISRGKMRIRRRKHVSGEVLISFRSHEIPPMHVVNNDVHDVMAHHPDMTRQLIDRSNLRTLISMGFLEVLPSDG